MSIHRKWRHKMLAKVLAGTFGLASFSAHAAIHWPQNQLLPSFSEPAQRQDFFTLRGSHQRWEAEGSEMLHHTGRPEGEGWLCQTGIDQPGAHMLYGPYVRDLPVGPNTAEFRLKTDYTNGSDEIVVIDVRDATSQKVLASRALRRNEFPSPGVYRNFTLPFYLERAGHAIELRVYWIGTAYTKVDWVSVHRSQSEYELYLFASLKGIVNKEKPRISTFEGDSLSVGPHTWLRSLGLDWNEVGNRWDLIRKYRSELNGIIIFDPNQIHTVNLATSIAGDMRALIASPDLAQRLTAAPYHLPVLEDFRGRFANKVDVYETMLRDYWPRLTRRLLIGLAPEIHMAANREYATAVGAAVVWLNPQDPRESELLNRFLGSMAPGASYMGWWPDEEPGIRRASEFGIATIPSDWTWNLTVHSGMPRKIAKKPVPPKPPLENKIYVAFILSDGDNLQYLENLMRKLWDNPDRGSVPIGWTMSPAMVDAMPGALNYYWQSSTANDNLISGPSGYGYSYPNLYPSHARLVDFVKKTEEYNRKAGFHVVTIWNTITGGINFDVGNIFATYAPSLLGMTAQNTGGGLSIYNGLPGQALACNYCTNEQAMKDHIRTASHGWNGHEPRFAIIQAQPWQGVNPTSFRNVANSLGAEYRVVRPDHLFQLLRESRGLHHHIDDLTHVPLGSE